MNGFHCACLAATILFGSSAITCATAEDAAAPAGPSTAPQSMSSTAAPVDDPNTVICHKGERITGSMFYGPSICHTRREWDDIHRQASDQLMKTQTTGGAGNAPGM